MISFDQRLLFIPHNSHRLAHSRRSLLPRPRSFLMCSHHRYGLQIYSESLRSILWSFRDDRARPPLDADPFWWHPIRRFNWAGVADWELTASWVVRKIKCVINRWWDIRPFVFCKKKEKKRKKKKKVPEMCRFLYALMKTKRCAWFSRLASTRLCFPPCLGRRVAFSISYK